MVASPSNRRGLRFSLRTLLALLTIVALVLGWQTYRARQQKAIVARVQELGGEVVYDYQYEKYDLSPKMGRHPVRPGSVRSSGTTTLSTS
jgi:hypothetical protein